MKISNRETYEKRESKLVDNNDYEPGKGPNYARRTLVGLIALLGLIVGGIYYAVMNWLPGFFK